MAEAWIIDGVRSPRGKGKDTGSLHHIHPQELLAQVLKGLQARVGFDPADVDDVMLANGRASFSHGVVSGIYEVDPQPEAAFAGRVIETTPVTAWLPP